MNRPGRETSSNYLGSEKFLRAANQKLTYSEAPKSECVITRQRWTLNERYIDNNNYFLLGDSSLRNESSQQIASFMPQSTSSSERRRLQRARRLATENINHRAF